MAGCGGSWVDKTIFFVVLAAVCIWAGSVAGWNMPLFFFRTMILSCGFIFRGVGCRVVAVANKKALKH